jgi:hypothetical protein
MAVLKVETRVWQKVVGSVGLKDLMKAALSDDWRAVEKVVHSADMWEFWMVVS